MLNEGTATDWSQELHDIAEIQSLIDDRGWTTGQVVEALSYIVTNGVRRNAMGRINSTGLKDYICDVFVSESMGTVKPSREYFDIVKKTIGDPDETYIVIGDSLSSDMLGARNSGLTSCWFMPEGDTESAVREYAIDYTAFSFDELYDIIMKWSCTK